MTVIKRTFIAARYDIDGSRGSEKSQVLLAMSLKVRQGRGNRIRTVHRIP